MSKYDKALEVVLKKMVDEKTAIAGASADIHNLNLNLPNENTPVPELVSWGSSFAKTVLNIITLVKNTSEDTGGFGKQFLTVLGAAASFVKLAGDYTQYMDEVDKDKARGDSEDKGAFVSILTMNNVK